MKRMIFKRKKAYYSIPIFTAVCATGVGLRPHNAAANTPDSIITSGSAVELDIASNWSSGVAGSANDVVIASPIITTTNNHFTLGGSSNASGAVSYGSINDTLVSIYYNYLEGSTLNTSSYTLNIGYGSNSVSPNPLDLVYVVSGAYFDFLSSNVSYGKMNANFNQSGNIDVAGTTSGGYGIFYTNSVIGGSVGTVINKTGLGYFELGNANQTYAGTWNLSAGIMDIQGGGGLGIAQTGVPELTFTGNSTLQFLTGINGVGSSRIIAINAGVTGTIDTNGYNVSVGSPIVAGTNGSGGTLTKVGAGILTLSGNFNFAQSSLTVSAGSLLLGVNANLSSPTLYLGNGVSGANYTLASGYNYNQSFNSVTLSAAASNISSVAFNNSSLSLNLGTLNRSAGATVDLTGPTLGTMTTLTPNGNFSGGQPTIINGYATYASQTTWAVSAASGATPGAVTGLATFDNSFNVAGADVDVTSASNTSPTITTVNSIRFNDSGNGYTITPSGTLTIASGGILETANVGSNFDLFYGGKLTSGNGTDLIITQANTNTFMDIYSTIVDAPSNAIGLTTNGAGKIYLFNANTFSGPTYVSGTGGLYLENQFALQNSTLAGGSVIFVAGIGSFSIGGLSTTSTISLMDNNSPSAPIALTIGGNNQNTSFGGIFTGSGSVTKIGTGLTYFANANSTFTGGLTIVSGGIEFAAGAAFGISNTSITNMVTIDNGAYIQYIAAGVSNFGSARGFILGGGDDTIQVGSTTNTSTSSLTIGASNNTGGILAAPTSGTTTATLDKEGLGTLIINTASTYNGGTNVGGGTLVAYRSGSLGVYSIPSNPSYTGNGPLNIIPASQFATVDLEAVAPQISSLSNYIGGNASGGTANLVLGFPAVNSGTTVSIGADNTSTFFSGNISDLSANYSGTVGSVIKVGTGILTLSGTNTYTGTTNVSAGTLALASLHALPASSNLTIGSGATTFLANASAGIFAVSLSTLTNSGLLDVGRNGAVIRTGSTVGTISAQVAQAFASGAWNGTTGITSSVAASDSQHLTAVGVIVNDNGSGTALTGSFDGANTTDGDILVKYTYYGDTDLNGKVDGSDYSRIDSSYLSEQTPGAPSVTGWFNGDFNYDNVVDGSDYTLIDNAFNSQSTVYASEVAQPLATSTAEIAAVPEPATLSLITLGTVGLLGSRRRRGSTRLTTAK